MDRMINVQSMVNKYITVRKPEYGINRQWKKKGQIIPLPFETIKQLLWDGGFRAMIDQGILYIPNMQDKIDLELEDAGTTKPTNIVVLNDQQILTLLKITPFNEFVETVNSLNKTQVDNIINYAINNEVLDAQKCSFLKDVTGMDILKTVSMNRELAQIKE